MDQQLLEAIRAIRELDAKLNRHAGHVRQVIDQERESRDQALKDLAKVAGALNVRRSGASGCLVGEQNLVRAPVSAPRNTPGVVRIEDIPGTRMPFVLLAEIPIGTNVTSVQQQSVTISQEGPFVAVKRFAAFLSQHSFIFTDPDTSVESRFNGRSFGRWRPIHSAADVMDSQHATIADSSAWFLTPAWDAASVAGTQLPTAVFTPPGQASSFRTMEFDGYLEIYDAGSAMPRQNRPVPSAMWSPNITAPAELGALDFFERGSVITWRVQPTHPNNPAFGNVSGLSIFPNNTATAPFYPFVDGQFDAHEGITVESAIQLSPAPTPDPPPAIYLPIETDPITRLPEGILVVGYEGYRIIQPAGATF